MEMSKVRLAIAYESQPLETAFSLFQKSKGVNTSPSLNMV